MASPDLAFFNHLSRMPNEILVIIFEMLTPDILILLENGPDWVRTLSLNVTIGDFRPMPFATLDELHNFIMPRSEKLKELYLDNLLYARSSFFACCVTTCENLKVLSMKNCSVPMTQFMTFWDVLDLEEISFSLMDLPDMYLDDAFWFELERELDMAGKGKKPLKKLTLEVAQPLMLYQFCQHVLPRCPDLTELNLYFSSTLFDYEPQMDPDFVWRTLPEMTKFCALTVTWPKCRTQLLDDISEWKEQFLVPFFQWLFTNKPQVKWKKFWIADRTTTDEIIHACRVDSKDLWSATTLYLSQKHHKESCADILKRCPRNSVGRLGLNVTDITMLVPWVQTAGGKTLRKLTLAGGMKETEIKPFQLLLRSCFNITELDITGTHIVNNRSAPICTIISLLKSLRKLNLPVCALNDIPGHLIDAFSDENYSPGFPSQNDSPGIYSYNAILLFKRMAKGCPMVEEFCLTGCCEEDAYDFCLDGIVEMYLWSRLKHVTFDGVLGITSLSFLTKVSLLCKQFSTLHLLNVGCPEADPDVKLLAYVLEHAKNFKFLRITHKSFDLSSSVFWDAVCSSQNLQGLCISTQNDKKIPKGVTKILSEMEYFHVLHIYGHKDFDTNCLNKLMRILWRKCGRNVENSNFILAASEVTTPIMPEPECHIHHCGFKDFNFMK